MDSGKDWQSIWFWSNPVCQGEPCWAKWAPCSCCRHAVWCLLCEWTLANHSWPKSCLSFSKPTDVRGRESKREELNAQLRTSWPTIYFWTLPQPSKPRSRWLAVSEGCLCGADILTPQQNSAARCAQPARVAALCLLQLNCFITQAIIPMQPLLPAREIISKTGAHLWSLRCAVAWLDVP